MAERVGTLEDAAEAFRILAAAEGHHIPVYATICELIAADPALSGLLMCAPAAQRLPVIVLAAIHDIVLRNPGHVLATWYPSVSGQPAPETIDVEELSRALHSLVNEHLDELIDLVENRSVQTNEVNRCCAWRLGLAQVTRNDDRPIHLVEIGASAGLNLNLDSYSYDIRIEVPSASDFVAGKSDSSVRLSTTVTSDRYSTLDDWQLGAPIVGRVGLDLKPLDVSDPDDARWLRSCVWPEQRLRFERLEAAIELTRLDPPRLLSGDLVDDIESLLYEAPDGSHVVILSSWVLAYLKRDRRQAFFDRLARFAEVTTKRRSRLTLLTLEADHILPWMDAPPIDPEAPAEKIHASILAATTFAEAKPRNNSAPPELEAEVAVEALARCQAHVLWLDPLVSGTGSAQGRPVQPR